MKKSNNYFVFYIILSLLLLGGCTKNPQEIITGTVSFQLNKQPSIDWNSNERTNAVEDFSIVIYDMKGNEVMSFASINELPDEITLREANYKVVAQSVNQENASFEVPIYYGEEDFYIKGNSTIGVDILCSIENVKITVGYTDLIKQGFDHFQVKVSNTESELLFSKEEERGGFFRITPDSTLTFELQLINNKGAEFSKIFEINEIKSGEHYHVVFDVEGIAGDATINIFVDETTNNRQWDFTIAVNPENIPVISSDNFNLKNEIEFLQGAGVDLILKVDKKSPLTHLLWSSKSQYFTSQGLPESFDLIHLTASQKSILDALGIELQEKEEEFLVDISKVTQKLPLDAEGEELKHDIIWSATNEEGVSYTDTTKIVVQPHGDKVYTTAVDAWAKFAYVYGEYRSGDVSALAFQYRIKGESEWNIVSDITLNGYQYSAKIITTSETEYEFRAYRSEEFVGETMSFISESESSVPFIDFRTWFENGSGNRRYALPGTDLNNSDWRSGDKGASELTIAAGVETVSPMPSLEAPEYARLKTQSAVGQLAAGSLFSW